MSNKTLTLLGLAAVVMVILAGITTKLGNTETTGIVAEMPLIQGLNPAQISKIVIGSQNEKTELQSKGEKFVIATKDGYPSDIQKVNSLINMVLDIKVAGEILTENPQNHAELELTDENAQRYVKFYNADGELITGVVVGKTLDSGQTVVRLANNDAVRTASGNIWFNASPTNFMDTQIFNVSADEIVSVQIDYPDGEYKMVSEPNDDEIKFITELPAGKKLKDTEYKNVFNAATSLRFEDVMSDATAGDIKFDTKHICTLDNSTVYTIQAANVSDEYFIKCSATFTDLSQIEIARDESQEELKKKEAKLLARDNAAKFNAKHKGWVYKVPAYMGEKFVKPLDDLIEDVAPPQPEDANQPDM